VLISYFECREGLLGQNCKRQQRARNFINERKDFINETVFGADFWKQCDSFFKKMPVAQFRTTGKSKFSQEKINCSLESGEAGENWKNRLSKSVLKPMARAVKSDFVMRNESLYTRPVPPHPANMV